MTEGNAMPIQPSSATSASWPDTYQAGTLESVGTIWERTGALSGAGTDVLLPGNIGITIIISDRDLKEDIVAIRW
jgi:hypothetical protein